MGMPPSGKRMSINVIDILRAADGKLVQTLGSHGQHEDDAAVGRCRRPNKTRDRGSNNLQETGDSTNLQSLYGAKQLLRTTRNSPTAQLNPTIRWFPATMNRPSLLPPKVRCPTSPCPIRPNRSRRGGDGGFASRTFACGAGDNATKPSVCMAKASDEPHSPDQWKELRVKTNTLHPQWILFARIGWVLITLFFLTTVILGLPYRYSELATACDAPACPILTLSSADAALIDSTLFSVQGYASFHIGLELITALIMSVMAGLIFWKYFDNLMGILTCLLIDLHRACDFCPSEPCFCCPISTSRMAV